MSANFDIEKVLKSVAVQIITSYEGTSDVVKGSGVIYNTSNPNYFYILTALHNIFGKRIGTTYDNENKTKTVIIKNKKENGDIQEFTVEKPTIIPFKEFDLAIIKIEKKECTFIGQVENIIISVVGKNKYFSSLGYPNFKDSDTPEKFELERSISYIGDKDFTVTVKPSISAENAKSKIGGYSGSGLFCKDKPVLVGIIVQIMDEDGFAGLLTAKQLKVHQLNKELAISGSELLKSTDDTNKIEIDNDGEIIDYEKVKIDGIEYNIWKAVKRLRNDMRDDWFQDPFNFEHLFSKRLFVDKLKSKNFKFKPKAKAKYYTIPKSGYSTRPTVETSFIDRIMIQAYCDNLADVLDKFLDNKVYSFRINSGNNNETYAFHYSIEQWKKYIFQTKAVLNKDNPYLVVADITNYFEIIHLDTLKQKLEHIVQDSDINPDLKEEYFKVIEHLIKLLKFWNKDSSILSKNGIPQNRDFSSLLANVFIGEIDKEMIYKNHNKYYYRFMDDIRIVCKSKEEAIKSIYQLSISFRNVGLNLNSSKTQILNLNDPSDSEKIKEYLPESLIEIEQISSLLSSKRKQEVQKAVDLTVNLFKNTIKQRELDLEEKFIFKRKIGFCIGRLQQFALVPFLREQIDFSEILEYTINELQEQPWMTSLLAKTLRVIDKSYYKPEHYAIFKNLILDDRKNIYEGQTYYIWLILSSHKYKDQCIIKKALDSVNSVDQVNQANTAGAFIYLASIDWKTYYSGILDSLNQGKIAKNYFLQRHALIALKNIDTSRINSSNIVPDLKHYHQKLHENFSGGEMRELFVQPLKELKFTKLINEDQSIVSP